MKREPKSPIAAAVFSFLLPGFGLAYALDHWFWASVNFVTSLSVLAMLFKVEPSLVGDWWLLAGLNAILGFVTAVMVNEARGAEIPKQESRPKYGGQLEAVRREAKSPFMAAVFSIVLPGYGLAYALDHWLWAVIDFVVTLSLFSHKSAGWAWPVIATNALIAYATACRVNASAEVKVSRQPAPSPDDDDKSLFLALIFNALLPGFGVAYALDNRRPGGLPGWEWGIINFVVTIALMMAQAEYGFVAVFNGVLAVLVTIWAARPTPRRELHELVRDRIEMS